jgi:hypothetical protein
LAALVVGGRHDEHVLADLAGFQVLARDRGVAESANNR